ncbi:F0F1 ATP synthase subunit epsilon [Methylomonas sp. LL1]|uniref:F0F1 ATP synthase subunit epsilon n=1 Tax=Methylomonas sp. LL1 TaxID=2785785 RepID=UPI0018C3C173|nr:F0F1 ATP synthase subunit epsilon [Methylomonas sp. LL1]QPK63586.1 F0F1 ATP synthase subunit epsilon [Methylomonas sp. LL1]
MRFKLVLPTEVLLDTVVGKIIAEAENGWFCLEPRHIDFVSALVPGLLVYVTADGAERFVGIDEGILVKCGPEVRVSTREAVLGDDPDALKSVILERTCALDQHERSSRGMLARLEAGVAKHFLDLQKGR